MYQVKEFLLSNHADFSFRDMKGTSADDELSAPSGLQYLVQTYGGNDVIHVGDGGIAAINGVMAGAGDDELRGSKANDYIIAGSGSDAILGGRGDNIIFGLQGDDKLQADNGNDEIHGGRGNDTLLSGAGDDFLFGDKGNDAFNGGTGHNTLYGGAGNDSYLILGHDRVFDRAGSDSYYTGSAEVLIINDSAGKDLLFIGHSLKEMTFSRDGHSLRIGYTDDQGSVAIQNFFQAGHAIEILENNEDQYSLTELRDLKNHEAVNGGDIW